MPHKGYKKISDQLSKDYYKWYNSNDFSHIVPEQPGCYAIYTFDYYLTKTMKLIYIGTAVNLRARLQKHEVTKVLRALTDDFVVVKCKVIMDKETRLSTEKKLIKKLKPKANTEKLCR